MTFNHEIKGNLARLLATENLVVEHRKVPTACFNVDTRVLTLPAWDRASSIVYDLLVGHEVGHALFTPNEDWRQAVSCPKDYINIIEDARIEKMMKRKYPGLRKSFAGGYKELNDQDFFDILDEDLTTYSLIDRINLHFKIGASALIPFVDDEQVFVKRTEEVETFEEVCQIATDIYAFSKQQKDAEKVDANIDVNQTNQGGENTSVDKKPSEEGGEGNDSDQNEIEEGQSKKSNQEGIPQSGGENTSVDKKPSEEGGEENDTENSKTQDAFNNAAEKLTNSWSNNISYVEIPENIVVSDYVADWTEVHDWIDEYRDTWIKDTAGYSRDAAFNQVDAAYREFRKSSQKEVNYLVKEFECRKSADAYARAGQSKTGVLDTTKLHTYRYNEDIFKKVTVLPDGKNHGLLFLLDWSGSMQREILATVKQLLNLTAFCKKVQIPFEVYAFTNEYNIIRRTKQGTSRYFSSEEYFERNNCEANKIFLMKDMFHLMNFVSSRSNSKDYDRMCLNLFREAYTYVQYSEYPTTLGISLSGTPLNEGIIMLNYLIPKFKKNNDLQKVNVCILTDGEACQTSYGRKFYNDYKDMDYVSPRRLDDGVCLRDRQTGRVYRQFEGWESNTNIFIQQLRDRNQNVNVLGFRIMGGSGLTNFVSSYADISRYAEVQKQWKKEKSAVIPGPKSYTALYVINNNALDDEVEFTVESGAKKTEITKAFKKMLGSKSANKKLLNSFVEYVA